MVHVNHRPAPPVYVDMTRLAPVLTLLAVAATAGALLVTTENSDPTADTATSRAAVLSPDGSEGSGAGPSVEVPIADLPVAGEKSKGAEKSAEKSADKGADQGADGAGAPGADTPVAGRTEISVADIPLVEPPAAPAPAESDAPDAAADAAYAGRTDDGDLTVAVAVMDGAVVAYVCDGGAIELWFDGTVDDGRLAVDPKTGDATMTGSIANGAVEGTVEVDGVEMSYSADMTEVADALRAGRDDVGDVADRAGLT